MSATLKIITAALGLLVLGAAFWLLVRDGAPRPDAVPAETARTDAAEAAIPESPYWRDQDRFMTIDGMRVRVREEGPRDAPVILMLHGFTSSLESWDAWAGDLSADHRVIRADLPGHGLTGPDPRGRYTVDDTVSFAQALMDAAGVERAVIAGNSLGGLVAWRLAARAPERVERLILIAPGAYSINGVTEAPVAVPPAVAGYLLTAPPVFVNAATAGLYGDPARYDPAAGARVAALMAGNGQAYVDRLTVFTLPAPETDLARVAAPALILQGRRDAVIPPDHAEQLAADMPDARVIFYEDLGHVPHEEDPARTLADVRAFLTEE